MPEKEYIEREPIIQFIEHELNGKKFGYDAIEILGEIQFAPAADVAPVKHGYWIKIGDYAFKCTSCGKMYWESKGYDARTHFCPNCGTRMDGNVKWR